MASCARGLSAQSRARRSAIVIRFQSVAPREGDALRIDYFRGGSSPTSASNATPIHDESRSSFTLDYRASGGARAIRIRRPISSTSPIATDERQVTVRGDARDVTLLVPVRRKPRRRRSACCRTRRATKTGFALITVTPPAPRRDRAPTPRDVTLVLDVSGSMSGRKIEQARAAGRQLLGTLRADDRFRLIDFSSDVRTFRDDFVAATPDNVREATRYLDELEAVGGTNIEGALREAIARRRRRAGRLPLVLFVTDGEPTLGEREPRMTSPRSRHRLARDRGGSSPSGWGPTST